MAEKKIGARIVIDGESEFRANLNSAKTALSRFQSELKLVNTVYKDNANSLAALRDKQQVYINLQQEQRNKVQLLAEMQDKAVKKLNEEQKALAELEQNRNELNTALEKAKAEYGENSEEVRKLTDELTDVNGQYEAQERIVQKTSDRVNRYKSDLNGAEAELEELNGEVERNGRYLAEAENSMDGCASSIDEYGNEVQESADKTSVFADVLKAELLSSAIKEGIRALVEGIKTIATAATQTGMAFESSMSQVAATMGMTTQEIASGSAEYELLSKAAQDCGKATMFSASQSAEALNYLALAGYDAEKAAATLPKVLNLAAAGGLDLAYASDLVTDSMAALGLETSELDNYIDEMAKTSQKSNTSVAQLGEATLVCAGSVALTGQSLETMNTALGVLANNGLKGAEGGTHLRNILLSLSAPTDKAADAIESLGLQVYDSKGNMRDLNAVITDMDRLMSDMTGEKKTNLIKTIFNKTDIAAVNALLKSTNGEYSDLNAQIKDCSGAAQAMADTLNDNLKGRVTILQSALEGLGITAYDLFDDEMKSAVDSATEAVGRLQEEIDNGDLGVSLRDMSKALSEVAENAIGAAEKALPKLIDGLTWLLENGEIVAGLIGGVTSAKIAYTVATEAATVAQKLFNVTANANPYIFLATAIAGVVGAITLYSKTADKETVQLTETTKKLTDASKKLNEETSAASQKRAETRAGLESQRDACIKLAEELDELQGKTSLTASEQARQAAIVDELNTAMPELNLSIDEQTGLTNMSTEALLENIDAQMALMKAEAARDDLKEIAEQQWESEKKLAELRVEQEEATNRLAEAEAKMNQEREDFKGVSRECEEAWRTEANSCNALTQQIGETMSTIADLDAEYKQTMSYIAENESLAKASGEMSALGDAALDAGSDIATMSDEVIEQYNDMFDSLQKTVWNQIDLFSKFTSEVKISKEEILANMQSQIDGVSQWAENMDELARRGIDQGLLQHLANLGPQGAGYVEAFITMTDDQLKEAGKMFEESLTLSYSAAGDITASYFEAGEDASQGFADGATGAMGVVLEAAQKLADTAVDTLKQGLDEHSPSKETEDIGKNYDEGLKFGIDRNRENVLSVIRQLTTDMVSITRTGLPPEEFTEMGRRVAEGLQRGIESGKSGVIATIQSMCTSAVEAARSTLDIHSPSKAFAWLGQMSGEGYITGWEDTMANINDVIRESLPDIQTADVPDGGNAGMTGAASTQIYEMCERMYNMMAQYMPEMTRMQVVTDTGALVGELLPRLDNGLGEMQYDKDRGLYE
ncbi:MAG: phage tail tape measure protein [Lachnospiraceae bacterium]